MVRPDGTRRSAGSGSKAQSSTLAEVAPGIESKEPRILADGRIIVGVTPQYLTMLYKMNTSSKADKLAGDFIGNWIEISGLFGDVTSPIPDYSSGERKLTMLVSFEHNSAPTMGWASILMHFDVSWQRYLELLIKKQEISVRGQVVKISSVSLELRQCELIDAKTREAIQDAPRQIS